MDCQFDSNVLFMVGLCSMLPVLFSVGNISVSSFGVFLAVGFLVGMFLIWRLCRAWDMDEEKTLDLTLLTFLGGLVGGRIYFVLEHLAFFVATPVNIILINKAPGFTFWGGFLGGWLTLFFFARRFRMDFWQLADIALVGLLGGLILTDMGCFLGGCSVGSVTKSALAVNMTGLIGKRWPVQLIEGFLLSLVFIRIWAKATHFHQRGKIASIGFIYIGLIKLLLLPLKANRSEAIFALILTILGLTLYYVITKQNPVVQIKSWACGLTVQKISKYWYNKKISFGWKLRSLKKLLRRSNVKFS